MMIRPGPIRQLEHALKDLPYGTRLSFQELSTMAGVDILENRSIVACVNRHLVKHHNCCLVSVRAYGYMVSKPRQAGFNLPYAQGRDGYLILDVMQIEEKPGEKGKQALLVVYRDLDKNKEEDAAIRKAAPLDTSVIEILKTRKKSD